MSLLVRLCQKATTAVSRTAVVGRHLSGVEGLEHIPSSGPFVLISNHTSFADHFIYDALLFGVTGDLGRFLTKAESFRGLRAAWFEAMGAVSVDRDSPARALLDLTGRILNDGGVLVIYPEGTRNRNPQTMMPFKDGAFRFADRAGVPVVPAAIWGSQEILPIGRRLPRRRRAKVVFGPPLLADPSLPRAARIRDLTERGAQSVSLLLDRARRSEPDDGHRGANCLAAAADAVLEHSLSGADDVDARTRHRQAALLLTGARAVNRTSTAAEVTTARLTGLRALHGSPLLKIPRILAVRLRASRALRSDPDLVMAHYLLGRWHLKAPAVLGGRRTQSLRFLARAQALAPTDTRYAMAHAEALAALGRTGEATAVLEGVIAAPAPDLRTRRRRERAETLREALRPLAAPNPPPETRQEAAS